MRACVLAGLLVVAQLAVLGWGASTEESLVAPIELGEEQAPPSMPAPTLGDAGTSSKPGAAAAGAAAPAQAGPPPGLSGAVKQVVQNEATRMLHDHIKSNPSKPKSSALESAHKKNEAARKNIEAEAEAKAAKRNAVKQ